MFPLTRVRVFDLHAEVAERFASEMSAALEIDVECVAEPMQVVVDTDLELTSGPILKSPTPVIEADWLAPGAFACRVDLPLLMTSYVPGHDIG